MNCSVTRRTFLQRSAALSFIAQFPAVLRCAPAVDTATAAAENAHSEIWRRLVDPNDVVLDYTDLDVIVGEPD